MESTNPNGDKVYTVTTHNPDGSTIETIYTFKTEKDITLTDKQKEDAAWEALAASTSKSVETLKAEGYTIYADLCAIPQETLRKHNITFKKIPRDIARL